MWSPSTSISLHTLQRGVSSILRLSRDSRFARSTYVAKKERVEKERGEGKKDGYNTIAFTVAFFARLIRRIQAGPLQRRNDRSISLNRGPQSAQCTSAISLSLSPSAAGSTMTFADEDETTGKEKKVFARRRMSRK